MRARRTSGLLLTVAVALTATIATGPASAASATSRSAPATTGAPNHTAGGKRWTLAGQACRLVSTAGPTATPTDGPTPLAGGGACPGVRPGAPVLTPLGQCTLNFLWRATDGRDYIGTAGHCLLDGRGPTQAVYRPGEGPPARDATGRPIGEFAYAALDQISDFALIRLDRGVTADPRVCRFGGPTGLNADPLATLSPLQHVGQGSATGSVAPARTQLAVEGSDGKVLTSLGLASPGDSGSPVVGLDGRAVGVVVATGSILPLIPTRLFVYSVRIAPEMGRAGAAMGLGFELVTAP